MSSPKTQPEIALATWPQNADPDYFGHNPSTGLSSCDAIWLSLRAVDPVDGSYVPREAREAVSNLGLWVWFDDCGQLQTTVKLRDVRSADLRQAEEMLKRLRWASKRLDTVKLATNCTVAHACIAMSVILGALGIRRALEYRSCQPDVYCPVNAVVDLLARIIKQRHAKLNRSVA